jgi:hypothetical protein
VQRGVLVFVAADAALAHFFVGTYIIVGEVLLSENDVEAHRKHSEKQDGRCSYDGRPHINI